MRVKRCLALLLGMAVAGIFLACNAAADDEVPSQEFILAALAHQASATVEVKFTLSKVAPQPAAGPLGRRVEVVSGEAESQLPIRTYIRTPEALYLNDGRSEVFSERSGIDRVAGHKSKSKNAVGLYCGRIDSFGAEIDWSVINRMETVLYPISVRPRDAGCAFLYGWLKYGVVSSIVEEIEGCRCWKVTVSPEEASGGKPGINRLEVWLDPAIGFCPRRIVKSGDDPLRGPWSVTVAASDYREIAGGIWFPYKQIVTRDWPKRKVVGEQMLYQAVEINAAKSFAKSELDITYPPGSRLSVQLPNGDYETRTQE